MRIRFLQTCPSENPHAPFQCGQVIQVENIPACVSRLVKGDHYVILDETERAVAPELEQPEPVGAVKGPNKRARH